MVGAAYSVFQAISHASMAHTNTVSKCIAVEIFQLQGLGQVESTQSMINTFSEV